MTTPNDLQSDQLEEACIHQFPAAFTMLSLHIVSGRHTLRCRYATSIRECSIGWQLYVLYHFNLFTTMSATFVRMQISSFVRIRSRKETSSIALSTAHCEILSLLIIRVFKVAVTANYTCIEKMCNKHSCDARQDE